MAEDRGSLVSTLVTNGILATAKCAPWILIPVCPSVDSQASAERKAQARSREVGIGGELVSGRWWQSEGRGVGPAKYLDLAICTFEKLKIPFSSIKFREVQDVFFNNPSVAVRNGSGVFSFARPTTEFYGGEHFPFHTYSYLTMTTDFHPNAHLQTSVIR